ncbi:hypothetical protein [Mucilaginibacter gracilis]|uniref:hypothetical protein n=1 Tax=Mucilaginibacter gracilis TaxID=423350 RepID=UPI0013C366FD|nr:hypothetical protein [Mucilaginibacter gracilis]
MDVRKLSWSDSDKRLKKQDGFSKIEIGFNSNSVSTAWFINKKEMLFLTTFSWNTIDGNAIKMASKLERVLTRGSIVYMCGIFYEEVNTFVVFKI